MRTKAESKSEHLQELIHRRDKVLAVLHPPTAAHARIMERAGCEALFVGTGGVVGAYPGLADVGTVTMTECVTIAGWIADSVSLSAWRKPLPESVSLVLDWEMEAERKRKLLWDNAIRFYARAPVR